MSAVDYPPEALLFKGMFDHVYEVDPAVHYGDTGTGLHVMARPVERASCCEEHWTVWDVAHIVTPTGDLIPLTPAAVEAVVTTAEALESKARVTAAKAREVRAYGERLLTVRRG